MSSGRDRLADVVLEESTLPPATPGIEHERRIALFDMKETNSFVVVGVDRGPYVLRVSVSEGRLALDVADTDGDRVMTHHLPMAGLRKLMKDYAIVCDSYHAAIRAAAPSQIEAIDMGRRGLHNEAAELLMEAMAERILLDLETARRLFTLVVAMYARG